MNKKLGLLAVIVCFALSSMQMSFAQENHTVFIGCDSWDNETTKDIGEVYANILNPHNLSITLVDAYPTYVGYVNFTVKNNGLGDPDFAFLRDIITSYDGNKMDIKVTYLDGSTIPLPTGISAGDTLEGLVTISVLNDVDEDSSYSFNIELIFDNRLPS